MYRTKHVHQVKDVWKAWTRVKSGLQFSIITLVIYKFLKMSLMSFYKKDCRSCHRTSLDELYFKRKYKIVSKVIYSLLYVIWNTSTKFYVYVPYEIRHYLKIKNRIALVSLHRFGTLIIKEVCPTIVRCRWYC